MRTVQIPGGEAVLRDSQSEMTPRLRKPIEKYAVRLGPKRLQAIQEAHRLYLDGDLIADTSDDLEDGEQPVDLHITEHELDLMSDLNDAFAWSLLASWTLDVPVPGSLEEFVSGGCPLAVYDVLRVETAKIGKDLISANGGFSVDAIEDPTSPTGA